MSCYCNELQPEGSKATPEPEPASNQFATGCFFGVELQIGFIALKCHLNCKGNSKLD